MKLEVVKIDRKKRTILLSKKASLWLEKNNITHYSTKNKQLKFYVPISADLK